MHNFSDSELRSELSKYGKAVGPLTKTTRTLFEQLLLRKSGNICDNAVELVGKASNDKPSPEADTAERTSATKTSFFGVYISEESDDDLYKEGFEGKCYNARYYFL